MPLLILILLLIGCKPETPAQKCDDGARTVRMYQTFLETKRSQIEDCQNKLEGLYMERDHLKDKLDGCHEKPEWGWDRE